MRSLANIKVQVNRDYIVIDDSKITIQNIAFIKEMLPRGSNGLVFQATDIILKRPVAVKIWIPRKADSRDRRLQALAEASKIAQLNHKNIVQIYQCLESDNGWIYSVMEYVDGVQINTFMKSMHSDFYQRLRLWGQIDEALNYSHKLDVFHGDLHEGNILIVGETVKVIDFGTSMFAARRIDSQMRETKLLVDLCTNMFSEYVPKLNQIIDVDIRALNPVIAMPTLSAWVDILSYWLQISNSRRYDAIEMDRLAFEVMKAPVFSIPNLVQQLTRKKVRINAQNQFIAHCLLWARVFLGESSNLITQDPQADMTRLNELTPSLREEFYNNGLLC
jgi:serine/threonine protein kinase